MHRAFGECFSVNAIDCPSMLKSHAQAAASRPWSICTHSFAAAPLTRPALGLTTRPSSSPARTAPLIFIARDFRASTACTPAVLQQSFTPSTDSARQALLCGPRAASRLSIPGAWQHHQGSVGLMDKASASGAGDSRFESWAGHLWALRMDGEGEARNAWWRCLPPRWKK